MFPVCNAMTAEFVTKPLDLSIMDIVSEVLAKSEEEAKKYKPTHVDKHLDLYYDLGTLLAIDENELDLKKLKASPDSYLQSLARDNTQCLINKLWELPTETVDDVIVAVLPKPKYILPRAQPVPKPKPPTKWEQFAKEKGIQKKKKDKLKWDEVLQKWVPLHGFQRAKAEKEKDWVIEVPENADPFEDQFVKKTAAKKEKVAKNEFQRLRNLAKAKNIKIPKVGFAPTPKPSATTLGAAITVAKASTASLGKFQEKLPKEKTSKHVKEFLPETRKRKLPALKPDEEKKKSMTVIDNILNKKPKVIFDKAVEDEVYRENKEEATKKRQKKASKKGKTKKGGKGGKFRGPQPKEAKISTKKGKSRARIRVGGKHKAGRKRR